MQQSRRRRRWQPWIGVVALLALTSLAGPAGAGDGERVVHFDIGREDAAAALKDFSRQAEIDVLAPSEELKGIEAGPLRGDFLPSEALNRLLAGSGLTASRDSSGALLVHRAARGAQLEAPAKGPLLAQVGPARATTAAPASAPEPIESIVVTGSYLRRTDTETPSPVQVIDADAILKSGRTTISDVIRSVSADNSGTLTQAFSGAMAGGANGVSLRGLTVDATLVLIDGHRMAPYPLADDGQRPFVDLSSLPLGIVERVEVLKDGASSTYGSDAIAGVVNIILKKQFQGFESEATLGSSWKGDGLSQRVSATWGTGNLAADGHNIYFNLEYRHQSSIPQEARGSYLNNLDLRPYGGADNRGGIVQQAPPNNGTSTVPGMVAPLVNGVQPATAAFYNLPGCPAADMNYSGGCTWDPNLYRKIQPRTAGVDATAHWTQVVADNWRNALSLSLFNSQSEQYRQSDPLSDGITMVPSTWVGSGGALVDQTNPQTTQILLPANSLDNPFNPASPYFNGARAFYGPAFAGYVGSPALLYAALTDFGAQQSYYRTNVIRVADDLTGSVADWDLSFALGYVHAATEVTYKNFIRNSLFNAALANLSYRVGQNADLNPASLYATIAPETSDTATSSVAYASAVATHTLAHLPGGDLGLAAGLDLRNLEANNPGEPYAPQGDIMMDGSFFARGSQAVEAGFVEFAAPVLKSLELNAAGRADHYSSFGWALTPKFGIKWTPIPQLAFRGTYAVGFRAPGPAEAGNSGSGSSTTAPVDPLRCPFTNKPSDCGLGYVAVLSVGNPNLAPEKSHSYTVGFVLEPVHRVSLSVDYFHIRRTGEIESAPLGLEPPVRGPQQPGTNFPGPIVYYPTPYLNASESLTTGFDGDLRAAFEFGRFGTLTADLTATDLIHSLQIFGGATYEYSGTVGPTVLSGAVGTPRQRGNLTLDWTKGPLSLGGAANYHGGMYGIDESNSGVQCLQFSVANTTCWIASFLYFDAYGQYQFGPHVRVTLNVTNVTNRLPPLNAVTYGGSNYNPSLDQAGAVGRFFELTASYRY